MLQKINILLDFKWNYRLCGHVLMWPQNTGFFAYVIFRKLSKLQQKTCRTFFSAPNQNYMPNLERFWQSSILSKKPSTLFPPRPSIICEIHTWSILNLKYTSSIQTKIILNKYTLCTFVLIHGLIKNTECAMLMHNYTYSFLIIKIYVM